MPKHEITLERAKDTGQAVVLILLLLIFFKNMYILLLPTIIIQVLNMTWPALFMPLAHVWFRLAELLGSVMSKVLLTITFALIVTPVGLVRKLIGKDPMRLKDWKKDAKSVFIVRNHLYKREDLEKPY